MAQAFHGLVKPETIKAAAFPVVCIGLSSGGVTPLTEVFRAVSSNTGMAFVVIHHVHTVPTLVPEILSACTAMPVRLAASAELIEPNRIYILPAGSEMKLADGYFLLRRRSKRVGFSNVLTIFLKSLAKSRHIGIAVILSGIDEDGAAALKAFREHGGITIVQEPRSAERQGMPVAAMDTGCVDRVLAPEAIPGELEKIADQIKSSGRVLPLPKGPE